MDESLTKSAQSVQTALNQKGLECKVVELSDSTRTAQDAASAIGCDVAQIVKSLIFKTKVTHKPVLILASGPNRVSEKVIESYLNEKITKADADFVRQVTGFAIGGIPPIGHKQRIDFIFIDEDLLKFSSVWAAAGTPNAVFNLQSKDLLEMTNGKIVSIK
jgi:prolyl-tRNA editing enzyme YbaK/EbsC (Cys-tRNA(Pro) deacylase)